LPVDPGEVTDALFRGLQVDERWSVRTETGFTWWPSWARQVVRAEPPREILGELITRVVVDMPLVRGVRADRAAALTSMGNADSVLGGVVYDARTGSLYRRLAVSLWDGNRDWLQPLLIHAAAVQLTIVSPESIHELARLLDGDADEAIHPVSGPRTEPDEMMDVGTLYVAAGARTSVTPGDFRALKDEMTEVLPVRVAGPSASADLEGGAHWSLASTRHPGFGWGLLGLLHLPFGPDLVAGAETAARLNVADGLENLDGHYLGGWLHDAQASLVHHTFMPELVFSRDSRPSRVARMTNLLMDAAIRARWARNQLSAGESGLARLA